MPVYSEELDPKPAIERMGDIEIYREVAVFFANHLPQSVQELSGAIAAGAAADAARFAHSLKSNCATVGAEPLRVACAELEALCRAQNLSEAGARLSALTPRFLRLRELLLSSLS